MINDKNNSLEHFGVLGMKWGRRSGSSGGDSRYVRTLKRDSADLRKHGFTKEAEGLESNLKSALAKQKGQKIKKTKWEPMDPKDKAFFKRGAKAAAVGLAIVGTSLMSAHLANQAVNKYYAKKTARALIKLMNNKLAREALETAKGTILL